jgi:hypothetical protein
LGTLVATSKVRIGLENFTLDGNCLRTLYGSEKAFLPIMSRVGIVLGPLEGIGFSVKQAAILRQRTQELFRST